MGRAFYDQSDAVRGLFGRIGQAVGQSIEALCFDTDEERLRDTRNAQLALYACGMAAFTFLRESQPQLNVRAVAGHSIGEYTALAASGVLGIEEGARLVQRRGELMARSGAERPGTMAAVLGMDAAIVREQCARASGCVVMANDNAPGQVVISGELDAVAAAGALCKEHGAKRVLPLNVSGAFHSPLMDEAAREMSASLRQSAFSASGMAVYSNVTASRVEDPAAWPDLLARQLHSPVRWTEEVRAMLSDGVALFIECGPGEVLTGLLKRIDPGAAGFALNEPARLSQLPEPAEAGL